MPPHFSLHSPRLSRPISLVPHNSPSQLHYPLNTSTQCSRSLIFLSEPGHSTSATEKSSPAVWQTKPNNRHWICPMLQLLFYNFTVQHTPPLNPTLPIGPPIPPVTNTRISQAPCFGHSLRHTQNRTTVLKKLIKSIPIENRPPSSNMPQHSPSLVHIRSNIQTNHFHPPPNNKQSHKMNTSPNKFSPIKQNPDFVPSGAQIVTRPLHHTCPHTTPTTMSCNLHLSKNLHLVCLAENIRIHTQTPTSNSTYQQLTTSHTGGPHHRI